MTVIPTSGAIRLSDFNVTFGLTSTASLALSWIKSHSKVTTLNKFSDYRGFDYYQNTDNADAHPYLQSICNCSNCVCANCACDCGCFLAGSPVTMADGSTKPIEEVVQGDLVRGAHGEVNVVLALHRPRLGPQPMYRINEEHLTTGDHIHIRTDNRFSVVSTTDYFKFDDTPMTVIDAAGESVKILRAGLRDGDAHLVKAMLTGDDLIHIDGSRRVESVLSVFMPSDTPLYNLLVSGSHTYFVNGYCVIGFVNTHDFDPPTWASRGTPWAMHDYRRRYRQQEKVDA